MGFASGHLNDLLPLILNKAKQRHGFSTEHSKLPSTKLCFADRRMKGINLILNRNNDEQLENVFRTWDVASPAHGRCWALLGAAYTAVPQPCPGTHGPTGRCWALWVHSKAGRDELVFSSPMCPKRMWLHWCHCALRPGDGHEVPPQGGTLLMRGHDSKIAVTASGFNHAVSFRAQGEVTSALTVTCSFLPRREGCFSLSCLFSICLLRVVITVICTCAVLILRGGHVKEACSEFRTATSVFSTFQQLLKNCVWFSDKLYPSCAEQGCLNDWFSRSTVEN